jgi:hypothetical protein
MPRQEGRLVFNWLLLSEKAKMASNPKNSYHMHARSKSLPSGPHPLIPLAEKHLCRLKASEANSSSSSIVKPQIHITGLQDLDDCIEELLLLPQT